MMLSKGIENNSLPTGRDHLGQFTYHGNPANNGPSHECIEASIVFPDSGPDAVSQHSVSVHSNDGGKCNPSSEDGWISNTCEGASGSDIRSNSPAMASTSSLGSSPSTSASSFYPAFSNHFIRISSDKEVPNFDAYQMMLGSANTYGNGALNTQYKTPMETAREEQHTPTLLELSPSERQHSHELTPLGVDTKSMSRSSAAPGAKSDRFEADIPFRQILQTASAMKNTGKMNTYSSMSSKINDLYDALDEQNSELKMTKAELSERDEELAKLRDRISQLERNNEHQQQTVQAIRDASGADKEKIRAAAQERNELILRNASLFHQMEYEKREWSVERERLSMQLNDVTRELDLQKMLLNGEDISRIVQRWESKVFDLEGMIADRDAAIRAQQQRIGDLRLAASRSGGELSSGDDSMNSSLRTLPRTDSATLVHLKRNLLQYLTVPNEEQYAQLLQAISNAVRLSDEDKFALVEHVNKHSKLRYSGSQR